MSTRIQVRRDLAANWVSVNPVLYNGEIGFATDLGKFKIGDGSTTWNTLAYAAVLPSEVAELAQDALSTSLTGGNGISVSYNDAANTLTVANTGTLSFNSRTGAVTLTSGDVTTALTYTPVSPTLLGTTVDNLENYADTAVTNEAIIRLAADDQEVIDRNAAIATAKSEAITSSNSTTTSKVGDNTVTGVGGNTIAARIATAKSEAISSSNGYTDQAIISLGNTSDATYVPLSDVSNPDGVASLDATGNVPISQLGNLIAGAPALLNTLDEIAAAINDDANISQTLTTAIGDKVSKAGDSMTGVLAMGTNKITGLGAPTSDNDAATKKYVDDQTTSDVSEGTNLYFTDERAQDAVGNAVGTGLTYTDSTGAISVTTNTYDAYGSASAVAGNLSTHESDTTTHGTTGNIVGTSDTQTLTNKTLTSPKINEDVSLTATATELNTLDGITASTAELNILDGVTSTAAELNILDGVTSSAAELNILDGATLTTTELNYVDGVTSGIQSQLNDKAPLDSPTFTTKVNVNTNNLNVGSGSEGLRTTDELTNPMAVFSIDADTDFAQAAFKNTGSGPNSSTDIIAYAPNGDDTSGWIDMGITSPTFSDPDFTITGGNDGYIFMEAPAGTTGNGNLVIATGGNGTDNKIVFAAGGLQSDNTQMQITPDETVHIAISTDSTSSTTGALTVDGGVGVVGALSVDGVARLTDTIYVGSGAETFDSESALTNPGAVISLTGGPYAQLAIHNDTATASADIIAYANNGIDTSGWIDMGITGEDFSQTEFGITGPNDGYIFMEAPATFTETITNKSLTNNVATLTVGTHEFRVGMPVVVTGVDATFNGTYTITAVTATTFSYAKTNANVTSAAATGTAVAGRTGAGNLVIATGDKGDDNKIVFAAGGYASGNTQMEITPDVNVHIEIDTPSTSPTTGALTVVGGVGVQGDMNIQGDVSIEGTIVFGGAGTTVETNNLSVTDPLVYVGAENASDTVDLGLVGEYTTSGTTKYAGVVRDASDGVIKFFKDTATKPTTSVDFTTTALADIKVAGLDATSITVGSVSNTEIGYLDGVTSAIQTQINDKAPLAGPTFTGTVSLPSTTSIGDVSSTEIGYLDGVTSSIQTQIGSKANSASPTFTGTVNLPSDTTIGNVSSTELGYVDGVTSSIQTQLNDKLASSTAASTYAPLNSPTFTGTVTLPANTISQSMMGDDSVGTNEIGGLAVTTEKIAALAVTEAKIADSAVTSAKIADGTIVNADINASAEIAQSKISGLTTDLDSKLPKSGGTMTGAITLSGAPTSDLHAATKAYVDNVTAGINFHEAVHAASVNNLAVIYNNGTSGVGATLTADTNRAFSTLDGESVTVGQRVLIKNQTDAKQNGIYTLTTNGSVSEPWVLTRATDADNNPTGEMKTGDFTFVQAGTVNASVGYINNSTANPIVIGTSNITYTEFNAGKTVVAGNGLTETSPGTFAIDTTVTQTRVSGVTNTEIGYLDGVTSAIQTQLNSKLATDDLSGWLADYAPVLNPEFTILTGTSGSSSASGTSTQWSGTGNPLAVVANLSSVPIGATLNVTNFATGESTVFTTTSVWSSGTVNVTRVSGSTSIDAGFAEYPDMSSSVSASWSPTVTTVSGAEISYLDGVTSSIQTQINTKAPLAGPTFTGTVVLPSTTSIGNISSTELGILDGATLSTTELNYVDGVTSAIQTQLDAKIAKTDISAKGAILVGTGSGTYTSQTVGTNGQVLTANSAQADGVEWTTISGYSAPTLGSTSVASGATVSNVNGLTINSTTIPSSATLAKTTDKLSAFAATTSSELAGVISDETGSGALVFGTNPTIFPAEATTSTAATGAGYMGLPQHSDLTNPITLVAADAGKHIYTSSSRTVTIPANASVAFPIGTTITFISAGLATTTIAINSDVLIAAGSGSTGTRTLGNAGMATAVKVRSNIWFISGNGLT
jgi:hypothetical protein